MSVSAVYDKFINEESGWHKARDDLYKYCDYPINKNDLHNESEKVAVMAHKCDRWMITFEQEILNLRLEKNEAESKVYLAIKDAASVSGEKLTEAHIQHKMNVDTNIIDFRKAENRMSVVMLDIKNLSSTINKRLSSIKILAQLFASQYWSPIQ